MFAKVALHLANDQPFTAMEVVERVDKLDEVSARRFIRCELWALTGTACEYSVSASQHHAEKVLRIQLEPKNQRVNSCLLLCERRCSVRSRGEEAPNRMTVLNRISQTQRRNSN